MSVDLDQISLFKTDKQCKEHWFNHLNPFLNRFVNLKFIILINAINFHRKRWTLDDDITLMVKSLENPKKWSLIAKSFIGRTQHQIKNRFFCVMGEELSYKTEKIRDLLKKNCSKEIINEVLRSLNLKQISDIEEQINKYNESEKNCLLMNSSRVDNINEMNNRSNYVIFNVDDFINRDL